MTLLDRILGIWSAIWFTLLPIGGLILGIEPVVVVIVFLLLSVFYWVLMFFVVFKTNICLDIKKNKLII